MATIKGILTSKTISGTINAPAVNGTYASKSELKEVASRVTDIEGKESDWNAKYDKPSDGIPSTDIKDGAITHAKLGSGAVGSSNISNGSVTTVKIADGAVTSAKLDSDTPKYIAGTLVNTETRSTVVGSDGTLAVQPGFSVKNLTDMGVDSGADRWAFVGRHLLRLVYDDLLSKINPDYTLIDTWETGGTTFTTDVSDYTEILILGNNSEAGTALTVGGVTITTSIGIGQRYGCVHIKKITDTIAYVTYQRTADRLSYTGAIPCEWGSVGMTFNYSLAADVQIYGR